MSDLTPMERVKLERLFRMHSGYVLNFTNRTFFAFVVETTRRDIDDPRYGGGSKASRLRAFWQMEPNRVIAKLTQAMIDQTQTTTDAFGQITASDEDGPLRQEGQIESEMTERILKSSISVLEAFNDVRNNQSLAHDNQTLNYDESLLIFNHVASSIRFIRSIEAKAKVVEKKLPREAIDDL